MCRGSKRKCFHCRTRFRQDPRNRNRQRYCSDPACQKVRHAANHKRWLSKPENRDYFKGADQVRRVQAWRKENPGYWRKKDVLQDSCNTEHPRNKEKNGNKNPPDLQDSQPLQDSVILQNPLIIGLFSNLTGHTLQDDIARSIERFVQSGLDIISRQQSAKGGQHAHQTDHPP
jgi:hypothetical protein